MNTIENCCKHQSIHATNIQIGNNSKLIYILDYIEILVIYAVYIYVYVSWNYWGNPQSIELVQTVSDYRNSKLLYGGTADNSP